MKHFKNRLLSAVLGAALVFSNAEPYFAMAGDDDSTGSEACVSEEVEIEKCVRGLTPLGF